MRKARMEMAGLPASQSAAIVGGVARSLAAAGTTSATAAACRADLNEFTTVAAGAGAKLGIDTIGDTGSCLCAGDKVVVANFGANAMALYPPSGGKINNGVVDAAISVPAGSVCWVEMLSETEAVARV